MRKVRLLSLVLAVALVLSSAGLAEALDGLTLYGGEVEAPAAEENVAAGAFALGEDVPDTAAFALGEDVPDAAEVVAPVPKAGERVVMLTDRKVSVRMDVGETLLIAVNAGETGTFTSKGKKYATVDDSGYVTALAKGPVKIEFKPEGGRKRTLSIKIVDPYEPTGVSVSQGKSITMNVGEAIQLNAVLAPETARTTLSWKSDKSKVASVEGGLVTALREGKAKLTVTTANRKKATVEVKVVDPYKPTGVRIGQGGAVTLNLGDTLQLEPVLEPASARTTFKWKNGNEKVACVDGDGLVTALREGKAKITVTTANGKKATITVTVTNPYSPTGVGIAQGQTLTMNVGERLQLDAVLTPESARTTLSWKSGKSKVAAVSADGQVTALATGTAKITVTTDNRLSATLEVRVIDPGQGPRTPAMNTATYNGVAFRVVNTVIDPMEYWKLVYDKVCTHPEGTDKYEGYCLCFSNFYVSGMVDNLTDADPAQAKRKYRTSRKLSYKTEKYSDPNVMMARLYDLLSAGVPQILMVEALLHKGSRHFVAVVGYRASVTRREDLRPEDLLVIDSYDGKLEAMDPAIEPVDCRHLFKKSGKYRIEAIKYRTDD